MKTTIQRLKSPTPKYFKQLRNLGLITATVATTIAAAPIALPFIVTKIAGYLALASGVMSAVSQTAIEGE